MVPGLKKLTRRDADQETDRRLIVRRGMTKCRVSSRLHGGRGTWLWLGMSGKGFLLEEAFGTGLEG